MTDDLRALAERVIESVSDPMSGHFRSLPGDKTRYSLARAVLDLLSSLEAAKAVLVRLEEVLNNPAVTQHFSSEGGFPMVAHGGWEHHAEGVCLLCNIYQDIHTILEGREEKP